jgi:CsoR family transcriptional regulator, copper-sensing transcriptional repressor
MDSKPSIDQVLTRLHRIEGQVRGLERMFEGGRACEDMLTQLAAIFSGLEQVGLLLMDVHLEQCVLQDSGVDPEGLTRLREALRLWTRLGLTTRETVETAPELPH